MNQAKLLLQDLLLKESLINKLGETPTNDPKEDCEVNAQNHNLRKPNQMYSNIWKPRTRMMGDMSMRYKSRK